MQSIHLQLLRRRYRAASGLTVILILAGVLCVAYIVGLITKKPPKDPDLCNDLKPWQEWRLRESSEKPQGEPSLEQPHITESVYYDMNIDDVCNGESRGALQFSIYPEGEVAGAWYGLYKKGYEIDFQVMRGDFEGRVYPAKVYLDENGEEDPSMLYFLAKGKFVVQESNAKKLKVFHRSGDIYIKGWLNPQLRITGEVFITSDEKYFEAFTWKISGPVKKPQLIF